MHAGSINRHMYAARRLRPALPAANALHVPQLIRHVHALACRPCVCTYRAQAPDRAAAMHTAACRVALQQQLPCQCRAKGQSLPS